MQLQLEFQITQKDSNFDDLDIYAEDEESCCIRESITKRNLILQLLKGLGADCNSIIASFTVHEDDISLHLIQ